MSEMQKTPLPQRKHPRLAEYDYSSPGAYFITICTQNRRCLLAAIVGRGLAPAEVRQSECGKIAEKQLLMLEKRFSNVKIGQYVIMPNHIHFILELTDEAAGASPRPTVMDVVCAYKSLTARACKERHLADRLFQTSFHDHIIRNREDYDEIAKYIYENPTRWRDDALYAEE